MQTTRLTLTCGGLLLAVACGWWWKTPPETPATRPPATGRERDVPRLPGIAVLPSPTPNREAIATPAQELLDSVRFARGEDREFLLETRLPALVAQDPAAASRAVVDIADEDLRQAALDRLARLWAAKDSVAALAWADQLPFADERETALTGACLQTATRSIPEAVAALSTHVPGDRPLAALEDLAQSWAAVDPGNARAWVLANESGPRRDGLVARVAFIQSQTQPAAAAKLVLDELPPGDAQNDATVTVVHQWARRDPDAASAWVASFAPGPLRERTLQELQISTSVEYAASDSAPRAAKGPP